MPATAGLDSAVVTAAMAAAVSATGMEVVFIGSLTEATFTFRRLLGDWPGLAEGMVLDRADSFCARLLAGAPTATAHAATDPHYGTVSAISSYGVTSYVGIPIRDAAGHAVATLCGIDHASVVVEEDTVAVLRHLAGLLGAYLQAPAQPGVVIRRTPAGWQVETPAVDGSGAQVEPDPDLTTALTLADLLDEGAAATTAGTRPPRPQESGDAVARLRLSIAQLEHALAVRVVVEQAIGVLAERQKVPPRTAFDRLRKAARSRGRKVHAVAREVVASAHQRGVPLPPELAGRGG